MPKTSSESPILARIRTLSPELPLATEGLISAASDLTYLAIHHRSADDHRHYAITREMMTSPSNKQWITQITDILFRTSDSQKTRDAVSRITKATGTPSFLPPFQQFALTQLGWLPSLFSSWIVAVARSITRSQFRNIVLTQIPTTEYPIQRNFNCLGEAILGLHEAKDKQIRYLDLLKNPDCTYVSVKISSLVPRLSLLDPAHSIETLATALRPLYQAAMAHSPHKTVTLDMEETQDIGLTVGVFMQVLNEPEFWRYRGGIVIQAYLPESTATLHQLRQWAIQRVQNGGGKIRIRIVKGANRAMETVEADLSGHPYPLFTQKIETDAHFKRLILDCCTPDAITAIDIGIATHNNFDLTFGLWIQVHHHPNAMIEMLQGMADDMVRALVSLEIPVLLYSPLATNEQYLHAVAYLIRRLDENTGPDHFLGIAHSVRPGDTDWNHMADLFRASIAQMPSITLTHRSYNPDPLPKILTLFSVNPSGYNPTPDSDWTQPAIVDQLHHHLISPLTWPQFPLANPGQIDHVIQTATAATDPWQATQDRIEILMNVANLMEIHRYPLIHTLMTNVQKPVADADAEVSECIDFVRYYCDSYRQLIQHVGPVDGKGPTLVCPPWNFPASIATGAITAALICGNPVIFKPAPEATGVGWTLAHLFWKAGIPHEVLQFITLDDDIYGQRLIQDSRITTVMLTGGTATAQQFLKWRPTLNLIAETGGKNTMIVSRLCDRDRAIKDIVHSAFGYSGQKCSATSLVILDAPLYDDPAFITHLKEATEALIVGQIFDLATDMGPLIRCPEPHLAHALTTLEPGEEWIVTPKEIISHLWTPGIKKGVYTKSPTFTTELFGPIIGLVRATDIPHAIDIANQTPYGLTAGIHSLDPDEISRWTAGLRAGNLYINRSTTGAIVGRQPFGGTKSSSIGKGLKAGGPLYLMPLTQPVSGPSATYLPHLIEWHQTMITPQSCSILTGQRNTYWLTPREGLALIIDATATLDHVQIAAQLSTYFPSATVRLLDPTPDLRAVVQAHIATATDTTLSEIVEIIGRPNGTAIRWIGTPSPTIQALCATHRVPLFAEPLGDHALWELPRWLREVSLSETTHRFGNTPMDPSQ